MKRTIRYLTLAMAVVPMLAMAGPFEDILGTALKSAIEGTKNSRPSQQEVERLQRQQEVKRQVAEQAAKRAAYEEEMARKKAEQEEKRQAARLTEEAERERLAEERRAAIVASGVSVEKASQMAGEMYQAYRYGGISEMLSLENTCWRAFARKPSDAGATSCSVTALAGAFVEASYARQQRRVPAPAYNGDGVRQRLIGNMAKAGIKEDHAQIILERAGVHQESVLLGLINAGMR